MKHLRPGGRSFKLVGGALLATLLIGIGFAVFVYLRMIRYERVAALHLPPDTIAAARVDLEKVVLYEPFRKELLPLIDELGARGAAKPRLQRFQRETKIDLALDVREVALARGPTAGDWVLVVGGKFPKQGVVAGVARVLREEGLETTLAPDERTLSLPRGAALGQAADGSIVIASSGERLAVALPPGDAWRRLGLDLEAAVSFGGSAAPLRQLAAHPAALAVPAIRELGRIEHVTGTVELGDPLQGEVLVQLEPGSDEKAAAARLEALISGLRLIVRLSGSDLAGEARVLESARVVPVQAARAKVQFSWQRDDVDRAAKSLAAAIRAWAGG